jgi:hypothetical protein
MYVCFMIGLYVCDIMLSLQMKVMRSLQMRVISWMKLNNSTNKVCLHAELKMCVLLTRVMWLKARVDM